MADPRALPAGRDIVVIGGSAGCIEPVLSVARSLPAGFPAAVFIVVHTGPEPGRLAHLIGRASALPTGYALHGEPVRPGRIYVAPPDNHMTLERGVVRVFRGPRENGSRPAVDPLFRSAARAYGSRVVGVVLSGTLDCGAHGSRIIQAVGGVAIVQDPEEALFPDMPRAVSRPDYVLSVAEIPSRLALLAAEPPATGRRRRPPKLGKRIATDLTCPECHGPLSEASEAGLPHFICHTGHAYSLDGLADEQARDLESALWSALRSLREGERLARRIAHGRANELQERFHERAESVSRQAHLIEQFLLKRAPAQYLRRVGDPEAIVPIGSSRRGRRFPRRRAARRRAGSGRV